MRRSWTPGQPDFLIDAWTPGPSLTFQDSMRTVLPGPKRQEYTPLIPQEALIFWTSTDVNILRAFASVNPEFLASLCICPFAANEALTEYLAFELRLMAEAKLGQLFSHRFDSHLFFLQNPEFPWNSPMAQLDLRQDLDGILDAANRVGEVSLQLAPGHRPSRFSPVRSAQPPHAYGGRPGPWRAVARPRRPLFQDFPEVDPSGPRVLYHDEPRPGVQLGDGPINPVAQEQLGQAQTYSSEEAAGAATPGGPPGLVPPVTPFAFEEPIKRSQQHSQQHFTTSSYAPPRPPPGFVMTQRDGGDFMSTADWLTRPFPNGDILLNVLGDLGISIEAFLSHGNVVRPTASGLNPSNTTSAGVNLNPSQTIRTSINRDREQREEEPEEQNWPIAVDPVEPIPYHRTSSYFPSEPYFERALRLNPIAETWRYTQEDADMAQRLRSGNAQNRLPNIPPPFPDLDSRSNPDSQFLSTTHIPEELWMGGPPRRPADYPPSVAALWERPTQSDTAPARVISETEQQEDETLLSVATFPLPQSESGSDGDEGIEMPTSSVSVPPTPPSSAGAIDAGHVYSGTIPFLEEAESQQDSPPIIEINQGRYRSYRDFAKTNQILHDLPEEEKRTYLCVFCKGNDEPPAVYKSHPIRINGIVACPHLRAHVCQLCKATGNEAHTIKYCPKNKRGFFATKARDKEQQECAMTYEAYLAYMATMNQSKPTPASSPPKVPPMSIRKSKAGTSASAANNGGGKVKAAVASGSRKKVVLARAVPRARRRAARRLAQVSTNARR